MIASVGIDVGTTETKCCALLGEAIVYEGRRSTPPLHENTQAMYLEPDNVWNVVASLLRSAILEIKNVSHFVISIACQAPSLCAWDSADFALGISYLSYYGDPKLNSQSERWSKACYRLNDLIERLPEKCRVNMSGLTGYLVYQLTGHLTMDSVTAWEIGIESPHDEKQFWIPIYPHNHPKTYAPIFSFPLNCAELSGLSGATGSVIVGTTDSAVLPLSIQPEFQDFYVYLGTWGSLLQSAIRDVKAFRRQYWSGLLHKWIISIPDMASHYAKDPNILNDFVKDLAVYIPKGKSVAFCGGLVKSSRVNILELVSRYLPATPTVIAPDASTALAAARLGLITSGRE